MEVAAKITGIMGRSQWGYRKTLLGRTLPEALSVRRFAMLSELIRPKTSTSRPMHSADGDRKESAREPTVVRQRKSEAHFIPSQAPP